jgi:hypothetical protein
MLKGKTVRLRFYLRGGSHLYAFQVKPAGRVPSET